METRTILIPLALLAGGALAFSLWGATPKSRAPDEDAASAAPPTGPPVGGADPLEAVAAGRGPEPATARGARSGAVAGELAEAELVGLRHAELVGLSRHDSAAVIALGREVLRFESARAPLQNDFDRLGDEASAAALNAEGARFRATLERRYGPEGAALLARRLRALPVDTTVDE